MLNYALGVFFFIRRPKHMFPRGGAEIRQRHPFIPGELREILKPLLSLGSAEVSLLLFFFLKKCISLISSFCHAEDQRLSVSWPILV